LAAPELDLCSVRVAAVSGQEPRGRDATARVGEAVRFVVSETDDWHALMLVSAGCVERRNSNFVFKNLCSFPKKVMLEATLELWSCEDQERDQNTFGVLFWTESAL